MEKNVERILLAVDGSYQSIQAARYISRMIPARNATVVIFMVGTHVPDAYWDGVAPAWDDMEPEIRERWRKTHENLSTRVLERIQSVFLEAGFDRQSVVVKTVTRQKGIARDIIQESYNGYDALAFGRTGISYAYEVHLGNVATKLVQKVTHIPLIMVGGEPETERLLVGFDGSHGSRKAVSSVKRLLKNSDKHVTVCHVVRSARLLEGDYDLFQFHFDQGFFPEQEKVRLKERKNRIQPEMNKAREILIGAGLNQERVDVRTLTGYGSRSRALSDFGLRSGYGTIVVGRRGVSMVQDFLMGRVPNKLVNMSDRQALWIVS